MLRHHNMWKRSAVQAEVVVSLNQQGETNDHSMKCFWDFFMEYITAVACLQQHGLGYCIQQT